MKFTIYGLRLRGETEARYIGRTRLAIAQRLCGHFHNAGAQPLPTDFARWLLDNRARVEAFQIDIADTPLLARIAERKAVLFCLALNHRLFNRWLVPAEFRRPVRSQPEQANAA